MEVLKFEAKTYRLVAHESSKNVEQLIKATNNGKWNKVMKEFYSNTDCY